MKAISLHQPWATCVAMQWKMIETRTHARFKSLVGQRIAIHAAKKETHVPAQLYDYLSDAQRNDPAIGEAILFIDDNRGKILCTVRVVRAQWAPNVDFDVREEWNKKAMCETAGKYCLFLDEIEPIYPIPFRGRQGIFNVPDELFRN